MPEMFLKQHGFAYSACGPFPKAKEEFTEKGDSWYICQNELDKACFQHDMTYGNFKGLPKRTASDKFCVIKHLILLKFQNIMDITEVLFQWFIDISIKSHCVVVLKVIVHQTKN